MGVEFTAKQLGFTTRKEAEVSYNKQIECLLRKDWQGFVQELKDEKLSVEDYEFDRPVRTTIQDLWFATAMSQRSLFATLPGCPRCASSIESTFPYLPLGGSRLYANYVRNAIMNSSSIRLSYLAAADNTPHEEWTRAALEEFKRRQLMARFELPAKYKF